MAFSFRKFLSGIRLVPKSSSTADSKGDLEVIDSTNKLNYHNGSSASPVVTEAHSSEGANRLQNKDLDASSVDIVDPSDTTKQVDFNIAGATTGTTTTLDFNQTVSRTITFPDADTTLIGADTSNNLTNKTLDDASVYFVDTGDNTKTIRFDAAGNSANADTTIASTSTGDATLSLPPATDTLVGRISTDTGTNRLQNKELSDNNVLFVDSGDTTKKLAFDASGITTGNTRTLTAPDANTTIVGTDATQVITNKDIDGGTAANDHRITLPKNTSANLSSLTRKEATIAYDTDKDTIVADNGSALFDMIKGSASPGATGEAITHGTAVSNGNLQFKKLIAGSNVTLTPSTDAITISSTGGGGGGGGSASALDSLKQKLEQEHYDIFTDPIDNSVGQSFSNAKPTIEGVLLQDLGSGDTTMYAAWNRVVLNDSDKDMDATTNMTAQGQATNLGTSGTKKIGTASISFDKAGSGTEATIRYDRGSANLGIPENTEVFYWINMPSVANFSAAVLRIMVDTSNYQTFTTSTDIDGNAITTGWNFLKFDVSTGGSATGTGWDRTKNARYVEFGVQTSSAAQTYTAILIDALSFGIKNPLKLVQKGNEYDIYDTSNEDDLKISSASTFVQGKITLTAAVGTAYTGGTQAASGNIRRTTLSVVGDNIGYMTTGLSGEIAEVQTSRISRTLPEALTGDTVTSFFDVNTNCWFEVTAVPGSTSIEVSDPVDQTGNLVSGKIIDVISVSYDDEKPAYERRTSPATLTITSSSHSSGTTTINTGTNTGIAVGDIVILRHIEAGLSCVGKTANESYTSLSTPDVFVSNLGIAYPNPSNIWAHWHLGGVNQTEALKNRFGTAPDLSVITTSPNLGDSFLNGQLSASGFTNSNGLGLTIAESSPYLANGLTLAQISVWVYVSGTDGSTRYIVSRLNSGEGGGAVFGWGLSIQPSTLNLSLEFGDAGSVTSGVGTLIANQWNHVLLVLRDGVANGTYVYTNGSIGSKTSINWTSPTSGGLRFGARTAAGALTGSITNGKLADVLIQIDGPELTVNQVESIYNQGRHAVLGFQPGISYQYESTSQVGQKLASKGVLNRTTDTAIVALRKHGAIVTG